MSTPSLENVVRTRRQGLDLSQQALAKRAGVTRQAIVAIEAGRQVPSTTLALRLARVLGCRVDELFRLAGGSEVRSGVRAILAQGAGAPGPGGHLVRRPGRVSLARVGDRWIAHELPPDGRRAADGVVTDHIGDDVTVQPFHDLESLERNLFVAGCAPVLGALAERVGTRSNDARVHWLSAGSQRALELLAEGHVHVAGIHLFDERSTEDNATLVQRVFSTRAMLVINLTRWRQGIVAPAGNPHGILNDVDLLRPGLRLARREPGAGAHKIVDRLLRSAGATAAPLVGPLATGHDDVARLVACGAADAGVAIEGVALAAGLDFVPLAEERFDLVVPMDLAGEPPVSRLIDALDDPGFRADLEHLPGYDGSLSGHVTPVNVG